MLRHLCQETGGSYSVALDESHFKELLLEHAPPPPAIADSAMPNLIKMGFPQRAGESSIAICSCHKEAKVGGGYTCPRCKARVCELPTECRICGLTLISSPHLARSYHHLFPIIPFDEVSDKLFHDPRHQLPKVCFGCQENFTNPGTGNSPGIRVSCPKCKQHFCLDCDIYIHESLHNCPGCESFRRPKSATSDDWTDANFWWLNTFLWTECIPLTKSKLYYGHVNAVCSFGLKLLWVLYQSFKYVVWWIRGSLCYCWSCLWCFDRQLNLFSEAKFMDAASLHFEPIVEIG